MLILLSDTTTTLSLVSCLAGSKVPLSWKRLDFRSRPKNSTKHAAQKTQSLTFEKCKPLLIASSTSGVIGFLRSGGHPLHFSTLLRVVFTYHECL